jgi:hypothetical protein
LIEAMDAEERMDRWPAAKLDEFLVTLDQLQPWRARAEAIRGEKYGKTLPPVS